MYNKDLSPWVLQLFGFELGVTFAVTLNPFRWKLFGKKWIPFFEYSKDEGVEPIVSCPVRIEELEIFLLPLRISFTLMTPPTRKEFAEAEQQRFSNIDPISEAVGVPAKYALEEHREAFLKLVKMNWEGIAVKLGKIHQDELKKHWRTLGGFGVDLDLAVAIGENFPAPPSVPQDLVMKCVPVIVSMKGLIDSWEPK